MKSLVVAALLTLASPVLAQDGKKLAPASKAQSMLGDVLVTSNKSGVECVVYLYEAKVQNGYRIEIDKPCGRRFPTLTKVKSWRVYQDGMITFVDGAGKDMIHFRGRKYTYRPIEKIDGIVKLASSQDVNE